MNYGEFLEYVRDGISKILGEESNVYVHKVLKNNNIELDALAVTQPGSNVSPTIYLNEYYNDYLDGRKLGGIINDIYDLYEEHRGKMEFDIEIFKDFEKIKKRIAFKVVNAASNQKLLEDVPNIPLLDLAIVFYFIVDSDFLGSATALIHNMHLELWNINEKELYKIAMENTPKILNYELRNMNEIIREMISSEIKGEIPDIAFKEVEDSKGRIKMYVLTNSQKVNGAACILYDGILADFASKHGKDLYILPSSVHEVILVLDEDEIKKEDLDNMVREVNRIEVDEGDILSDHAYIYRKDINQICM